MCSSKASACSEGTPETRLAGCPQPAGCLQGSTNLCSWDAPWQGSSLHSQLREHVQWTEMITIVRGSTLQQKPWQTLFTHYYYYFTIPCHRLATIQGPGERGKMNPLTTTLGETPRESPSSSMWWIKCCHRAKPADQINPWPLPSDKVKKEWVIKRKPRKRMGCPVLTAPSSTPRIPSEYLSKILCGCITLWTTWVRWSWAATTSGGGLYLFTAKTCFRIRNAKGNRLHF